MTTHVNFHGTGDGIKPDYTAGTNPIGNTDTETWVFDIKNSGGCLTIYFDASRSEKMKEITRLFNECFRMAES